MTKSRILIVEDEMDVANMLSVYFEAGDHETLMVARGQDALDICREKMPNLVILDINLPDIDGYEVCRGLREHLRTSHIPIIFLTQRDERSDRIAGLELGADDYITKPFDLEELGLRVQNALQRASRENLTNPTTGLPSGRLIEEQLKQLLSTDDEWTLLYMGINGLDFFNEVYGFVAGDHVLRFAALLLSETVNKLGTYDDFVGHTGGDDFIVVTVPSKSQQIKEEIVRRFNEEVQTFYSFTDRERGYLEITDAEGKEQRVQLMTLSLGEIDDKTAEFSDIMEITEVAAEVRRRAL
jgi:diguanylate cyclase (GGDEF)-like protein